MMRVMVAGFCFFLFARPLAGSGFFIESGTSAWWRLPKQEDRMSK
jgi:hypothetical protein